MLDQWLREPKERLLAPFAPVVGRYVPPIAVTLFAFGCGVASAICLVNGTNGLGLFFWLCNRTLDGFDGTLARVTNSQSDFGGYIDMLLDTLIYALIPVALVLEMPSVVRLIALSGLLSSFYINTISWAYLASILEKRAQGAASRNEMTSVTMPTGLIEGTETVLFFTTFIVFDRWLIPLFWLMAGLVMLTILQRGVWAHHALKRGIA